MKIERLGQDKIKIFLTFDDLMERGIHKDDMWKEIPKVHELFSELMDQAYTELGFDATGPLAVEVFALPAQGMVVIVTKGKIQPRTFIDDLEEEEPEVSEMEVTLEETDLISYAFKDFEDVVSVCKLLSGFISGGGRLYSYRGHYILQIEPVHLDWDRDVQRAVAILSEFGEATSVTEAVLDEYGKLIIADGAIGEISFRF